MAGISERHDREGLAELAVHVWAEALTNVVVAERLNDLLNQLREDLADLVETSSPEDATEQRVAVATVLTAVLPGLILQLSVRTLGAHRRRPRASDPLPTGRENCVS